MSFSIGFRSISALLLASALALPQTPPKKEKERDLKYEKADANVNVSNVTPTAPAPPSIPRSYALVVGVSHYQKLADANQLQFPERDADSIYSILISKEGGNFRAEDVHRLTGSKATLANVRNELENWLPSVTKDNDRVLIYFAGHGFVYNGAAYLAPYDIDPGNIAGTGYSMDQLGKVFGSKIKGKWKVLLTDSCHSGNITPETDREKINQSLQSLNRSVFSLTASRAREQSFESPDYEGGHGVFTYFVVKGMQGQADENHDGIVTADELQEYVRRNVREATNNRQTPTSDKADFDPSMLLAYYPSGVKPGNPPPPKEGTLIVVSNMDGVEMFVDDKSVGVANKGQSLRVSGLTPGIHVIKGVRLGYEPDGPREENIYPGQETTVNVKILIPRRRTKAAVDAFDKGMEFYKKGQQDNYKKAVEHFAEALQIDPKYSQAALYLGRAYNALYDEENSRKYFQKAIEIDPDYLEARASYGGMLLDVGDLDEAVRQLNTVVTRDKDHALAWYLLSQALTRKESYAEATEAARKAVALTPKNGEAHLCLAQSLRMSEKYAEAIPEYQAYLQLSDFDSKLAGKINYYAMGYLLGMGKKKRAAQADIWKDLREQAYFGICNSEYKLNRFDAALNACRQSLMYDARDAYSHWVMGLSLSRQYNQSHDIELLSTARFHFNSMVQINPDLDESNKAKKMMEQIDQVLKSR